MPDDVDPTEVDDAVRRELRTLARPAADAVARHLAAAGRLLEEDPETAFAHTIAARRLASRLALVREAVGIAAYQAGEWQTAIAELRTYQRLTGRQEHFAIIADCERALGRPERAIDIFRTTPIAELAPEEAVELLIVTAGARGDLGQREAAVATLQVAALTGEDTEATVRLRYAYADALLAAGQERDARVWFARAAAADQNSVTDAAERLLELDGITLDTTEAEEPVDREEGEDLPLDRDEEEGDLPGEDRADAARIASSGAAAPGAGGPDRRAAVSAEPDTDQPNIPDSREPYAGAGSGGVRLVDDYDLVLLDLDGVLHLDGAPVAGAADVMAGLRRDGPPVVFVTNNASRSPEEVASMLAGLGVEATPAEVLTSATAAAAYLAEQLPEGAAVLAIGTPALAEAVRGVGLRPVSRADDAPAAVVQGYGPQVGWSDLAEASIAVRAGARWVVTNTDATFPTGRGLLPGNGALVAALRTALDREPDVVIGKPEPTLFRWAARRAGAARPLVVGDRLDTDIDGALNAGMDSLLVLTGVDTAEVAHARPSRRRPTYVGDELSALLRPPGDSRVGAVD
jgi:glycerol-1-phosphatase